MQTYYCIVCKKQVDVTLGRSKAGLLAGGVGYLAQSKKLRCVHCKCRIRMSAQGTK